MPRTFVVLLVGILSSFAHSPWWEAAQNSLALPAAPADLRTYDNALAYDVYAAVLVATDQMQDQRQRKIVIREETELYKMCIHPEGESARQIAPAVADYNRATGTPWRLQKNFKLADYELAPQAELDALLKNNPQGWQEFHRRYPGAAGYVEFSAVGFNADKTVAVVYIGQHCGNLCGSGQIFVMQLSKRGKWQPMEWEGEHCFWNK